MHSLPRLRRAFLPLFLLVSGFAIPASAATTTVTLGSLLSGVSGGSGVPMPYGTVCARAVNAQGTPISITESGWGLVPANTRLCANVVAGAISGGLALPDASHTYLAAPIYYNFTIQQTDASGDNINLPVSINNVAGVTGSTFALDTYAPPVSAPATSPVVGYGSVPSTCTAPSIWTTPGGSAYVCVSGSYVALSGGGGGLTGVVVAGVSPYTTLQSAVNAASSAGSSVLVPGSYAGTDTYTNPAGVPVTDQRIETRELAQLSAFMAPWLNKLGAGAGGNLAQLAKCIQAKACIISAFGNSILGYSSTAYEDTVMAQLEDALEARYGHIFTWYNHSLPGRSIFNAVGLGIPYSATYDPQLPVCPTGSPNCATIGSGAPYSSYSGSSTASGGAFYFPATAADNAKYGPPFSGADRKPWPAWTAPTGQGWLRTGILESPDAVLFLFGMNDQSNSGASFVAAMQAAIAPFLALTKVPSIVLIDGPNGSTSTTGAAYFTQSQYARLDELEEDVRGLAEQQGFGLIDAGRIFSALRDGSDPVDDFWEIDSKSFLNFSTNWAMSAGTASWATVSGDGTSTVVSASVTATTNWQAVRKIPARDVQVAAVWNTSNAAVVPAIQWRVPADLSTSGYQAYLFNNGDGTGHVGVYSAGGGSLAAYPVASGIGSSTSFMLQAVGNKYYIWVNGKLVAGPGYPTTASGYDYDSIAYGYAGVGTVTQTSGTSYTSAISYVTVEAGNPLAICATAQSARQAAPPCAPAFVSDQALYGWVSNDLGTNAASMGGNLINHPSIPGVFATYGVAMGPMLDHLDALVGGFTAGGDLGGTATSQTVTGIQGHAVASTAPTTGQALVWNGTAYAPAAAGGAHTITIDHSFSGAGTTNYTHNLGSLYPLMTCYVNSGSSSFTASNVDTNNIAITVTAASDITCTFGI